METMEQFTGNTLQRTFKAKKMKTNLSVELVKITPDMAKNLLRFNTNNRQLKEKHVAFLSTQIKNDRFLENGEAIIFDYLGVLKDGQHRLKAISINDKSFYIPVVRGVDSGVMATYDTGKNRSAGDVLHLNGFPSSVKLSVLIQSINNYSKKSKAQSTHTGNRGDRLSNQMVLEYAEMNYEWLSDLIKKSDAIYVKSNIKVLTLSAIGLISYIIGGRTPSEQVYKFMKHLVGNLKTESSAPLYVYNKLYNAKINKEPLNFYWILGMSIKAWNFYSDGNPAVKYFTFKVDAELPEVNKTININN